MRASASKNSCSRSRMFSSAMRLPARRGLGLEVRVLDAREHAVAAPLDAHQHVAGPRARLDAVVHRVLEQRLQHERRQQRVRRRAVELPGDAQALAEAQLLEPGVALEQRDLVGEAHELRARPTSACGRGPPGPRARARRAAGRGGSATSTAFRLLNRKCGRMRACSACSRASASAGECALAQQAQVGEQRGGDQRGQTAAPRARRRLGRADRARGRRRRAPRTSATTARAAGPVGQPAQQCRESANSTTRSRAAAARGARRPARSARAPASRSAAANSAPASTAAFTASSTRAMTPRLRKSGRRSG